MPSSGPYCRAPADIDVGATATIHGDVNLSNCLARPDGTIVLIDWDQAGHGRTALDLGYPLVCVFLTKDLDWRSPMAAPFYKAYQRHRPLPDAEQIFNAALLHAMRYMAFHHVDMRWRRAQHAARHKPELTSVLTPAQTSRRPTTHPAGTAHPRTVDPTLVQFAESTPVRHLGSVDDLTSMHDLQGT